jgi:hypothetical protein
VDDIRLGRDQLTARGSYDKLVDAIGMFEKMKLRAVPRCARSWRAKGTNLGSGARFCRSPDSSWLGVWRLAALLARHGSARYAGGSRSL